MNRVVLIAALLASGSAASAASAAGVVVFQQTGNLQDGVDAVVRPPELLNLPVGEYFAEVTFDRAPTNFGAAISFGATPYVPGVLGGSHAFARLSDEYGATRFSLLPPRIVFGFPAPRQYLHGVALLALDAADNGPAFGYTLTISTSSAPEPATWAMMVGGFGLVGAASRLRARASITYA